MEFDFSKEPGKNLRYKHTIKNINLLITIITPFYNGLDYFRQTFNCVMSQTFPYFEWIIVDDGSTEETSIKMINELCNSDSRIRVYRQANQGQAAARNLGIHKSTTEIIVPLDADDLLEPTYLEMVYFALWFNKDVSWAYTDSVGFGAQQYLWSPTFSSTRMKKENILVCTAAIRKSALLEVGGYDDAVKHCNEDWHLWLKLLAKSKYPMRIKEYGFWYRRSDTGSLARLVKDKQLNATDRKIVKKYIEKVPDGIHAVEPSMIRKGELFLREKFVWRNVLNYQQHKIKVLMLIPHMVMGGADLFNLDLISGVDKSRFSVGVITTVPSASEWKYKFKEQIDDVFELPNFLSIDNWSEFILYYIKSRNVDIVFISNSYYGYYIAPLIRKEFPKVAMVDYVHMEEWYWRSGGYARTSMVASDVLEKTYVCNEHLRQVMINDFFRKEEDVQTVYIGVDTEKYDKTKIEVTDFKESLNISIARKIVLFPCRMHPQKRPFLMIEIAKKAKEQIPNICFLVAGDGVQFEDVKNEVRKQKLSETIVFLGQFDDMKKLYAISNLTLICSLKEGLALTAYESMAMGVPVVTSDVGGQSELVNNNNGRVIKLFQNEEFDLDNRYFSQEEIALYVDSIMELLKDSVLYHECSLNCRKTTQATFSKKIMIKKMEQEFEELINHSRLAERKQVAEKLALFPNLVNDYLNIYMEYEVRHNAQVEIYRLLCKLKALFLFKENPINIIRFFYSQRNNFLVAKILKKIGFHKFERYFLEIIYKLK